MLGHITPYKIMFTKSGIRFEAMAVDPARRRAAINDLTWRRNVLSVAIVIGSIGVFGLIWEGKASGVSFFAILFSIFYKIESDLVLLRVIDRLQKGSDDKPVA